jgi:NAD+ kinase
MGGAGVKGTRHFWSMSPHPIHWDRMQRVAIVSKPHKEELGVILPELVEWLKQHNYEPVLDFEGGAFCKSAQSVDRAQLPQLTPALVIVLGGDGTLLAAARVFAATGVPILGVNLGFLGFLTEIRLADLYTTLDGWCNDCHTLEARALLHAAMWRDGKEISAFRALNEVVISKGDIARMGDFAVELEGKLVARFRADGVIVSTPTGSTAYTLAANGPILTPDVDALVVTPICPHLLTLRPLVVPGTASLAVRVEGVPNQCLLTVDGQQAVAMQLGDEVRCKRSSHTVNLVRIRESGFFEALRSKLSWGER